MYVIWWCITLYSVTIRGLTPAEADLEFLTNATKCALYGMDFYSVKDSAGRQVGIMVINTTNARL